MNALLAIPEIKARLKPHLCLVTSFNGKPKGFENVQGIKRRNIAEFVEYGCDSLSKNSVYLLEYREVGNAERGTNSESLRDFDAFKGTTAFFVIWCNAYQPGIDNYQVPTGIRMFQRCRRMNIVASPIMSRGGVDVDFYVLENINYTWEEDEEEAEFDTDNILFYDMNIFQALEGHLMKPGAMMKMHSVGTIRRTVASQTIVEGLRGSLAVAITVHFALPSTDSLRSWMAH